jgi:para-nitrobenzyl esterase
MRLAEALAASGARVFAYQFAWAPPSSRFKACHCIDLPFTFGTLDAWPDAAMLAGANMPAMHALSATMRRAWAAFLHDGDPGQPSLAWTAYDAERRATMVFDTASGMMGDPFGLGWRA